MGELRIVHLDTQILIWLFEGKTKRLTREAARAIEKWSPVASATAVFELQLLYERGRRANTAEQVMGALATSIGLAICNLPFHTIVEAALSEGWSADPWDRLIVANAKAAGAPLVTADQHILQHYSRAIW